VTAAVARVATATDHPLLDGYIGWCGGLGLSDRALRDRLRAGRAFLADWPDPETWMNQTVDTRLADLARRRCWPMVVWLIGTGHLRLDLELAGRKQLQGLAQVVEATDPAVFATARSAAARLGWALSWTETVLGECLAVVMAWRGCCLRAVDSGVLDDFAAGLRATPSIGHWSRRAYLARLHSARQLLYELNVVDTPPTRRRGSPPIPERFMSVPGPAIREALARYVETRAAVLAPKSIDSLVNDLVPFGEFLGAHCPDVSSLRQLERRHVEAFLVWNRHERTWRGRKARAQRVSDAVVHSTVLSVRNFLDDICLWGWADRPARQLLFAADVPRLPRPLPRALPPHVDAALMAAVTQLEDPFACTALILLRRTGLRIGECLDLELSCVVDYGPAGTWLRVPLGKLATERAVPLDAATVTILDDWVASRGRQRALPHPRTGQPADFLFVQRGRRLGRTRLVNGLAEATRRAGLLGSDGEPLAVTPHQLRHTYGTELINAGMSLQALMALMGHVTAEMTLRYATLASPTLRHAYEEAIGKVRRRIPLSPPGRPPVPDRIEWLAGEFLKTRVAHGYCSRHIAAEACPYANVCETCDNFVTTAEFLPALEAQLADVRLLQTDAEDRGWTAETERHQRVIRALERHTARLAKPSAATGRR